MIWTIFKKEEKVIVQRDHNYFVQGGKGQKMSTKKMGQMFFPCMIGVCWQGMEIQLNTNN